MIHNSLDKKTFLLKWSLFKAFPPYIMLCWIYTVNNNFSWIYPNYHFQGEGDELIFLSKYIYVDSVYKWVTSELQETVKIYVYLEKTFIWKTVLIL